LRRLEARFAQESPSGYRAFKLEEGETPGEVSRPSRHHPREPSFDSKATAPGSAILVTDTVGSGGFLGSCPLQVSLILLGPSSPWTFLHDTRTYASRALPPHSPTIIATSVENHLSINAYDSGLGNNLGDHHFTPLPKAQADSYIDGSSLEVPC